MADRISTGIPRLDETIDGGIVKDSVVLVTGSPGSGKTTLGLQFLIDGLENGERCLYITTEETPDDIRGDAASFGWDLSSREEENLHILYLDPATESQNIVVAIRNAIDEIDPDRTVLDSLSVIGTYMDDTKAVRRSVHELVQDGKHRKTTMLMTAEIPDTGSKRLTRHGVAEFVADGVIYLSGFGLGEDIFRSLRVIKMRQTDVEEDIWALDITNNGIELSEEERL